MDRCVRVFYGASVSKGDGIFEDMDEEVEWFDEPPSFNDLCVRLDAKFGSNFTLKGRFDSEKTRAHYVVVPLRNPGDWSHYNRVLKGSNVTITEVVVENGYRIEDDEDVPYNDGVGYNEQEVGVEGEGTQGDMDLDGQLTQEQFQSAPVGRISNDFDVREFAREEEQEAEDRMADVVSSDSNDSDDDNGDTDARATPIGSMPAPVLAEVLHAMPT
jgi:hypothetical protein